MSKYLTNTEVKEIKEEYPNAEIIYKSTYGKKINYNAELCFIGASYNPKTNKLIFLADARVIKE